MTQTTTPYKYGEFNDAEFAHFGQYGGTFTYMAELPHGTAFYVHNGMWEGRIVHRDGDIYIQTTTDDSLCENGEHQYKIDPTYYLWIKVLEDKSTC